MYEVALSILKLIHSKGYEAYIVGGYARDQYLGILSTDIDICTSLSPELIEQFFSPIESHPQYGSFVIERESYLFEITTYRKDYYMDTRYPKIEFVSTLEEDLKRRDFIINTLCIDYNGEYVDLLGARKDIDNKVIRMVGEANIRLKEDPLRMIRAIRFASDLDFELDGDLRQAILNNKMLLTTLSSFRIQKEIDKVKNKKNWNYWIQLLDLESNLP